ncbi:hypothetical protein GOODEAATRI_003170, partial [Goodea atripinnis]
YVWEKSGSVIDVNSSPRLRLDPDGTLHISQTWSGDIGTYTCRVTSVGGNDSRSAHLRVRLTLPEEPPSAPPQTVIASGRTNQSIMIQWQPPPENHQNGPLQGYIISAHCATRKRKSRGCQLHHCAFYLECPKSSVYQWNQPGVQGYRISWEEFNRTNTRVTHYLPNLTQEYKVTGLTALTTYTIQVAAMTSKGQGQLSASTISSGVPPDFVGYRIQYFKAGSKGGVLSHIIMDRLEREFTIEDLEEWTEYEVRVQAVNGIGSGPWSQAVHGRTRESGEDD